jgi:hypothetical protein
MAALHNFAPPQGAPIDAARLNRAVAAALRRVPIPPDRARFRHRQPVPPRLLS